MKNQSALSDPIALRIPLDVLGDIETIAEISERSRSWVIVRALKSYLAAEGRDILSTAKGRKQIADVGAFELEDVIEELDADSRDAAA